MSRHTDARVAGDVMDRTPLTVRGETPLDDLAHRLIKDRLDGACVLDDSGKLVGVVTTMDLIFQEQAARPPHVFAFLDAVFAFDRRRQRRAFIRKLTGNAVADIMTVEVITAQIDTPLSLIAERMVQQHLTVLPVVDSEGSLLGVVDKRAMLHAAFADG